MKAIVNIGLRIVELQYTVKQKDMMLLSQNERNKLFNDWEIFQKNIKSDYKCKHTLRFKDCDEWLSSHLFDGRMIDFHYDFENRKDFDSKKDWGSYIFQGYEYIEGEPQLYDTNVVDSVVVIF